MVCVRKRTCSKCGNEYETIKEFGLYNFCPMCINEQRALNEAAERRSDRRRPNYRPPRFGIKV